MSSLVDKSVMKNNSMVNIFSFNSNTLKLLAIFAMIFDHAAAVFAPHDELWGIMLRIPGRIAAPLFCYFIAEGYFYTSNKKRYLKRLLLLAVISHYAYNLLFGYSFFQATSIMWGLSLGLIALISVKSEELPMFLKVGIVLLCCFLAIPANWNFIAVLWIVVFGIFHGNKNWQILGFLAVSVLFLTRVYLNFGPSHYGFSHWYQLGIFLAIPLIYLYNGQRGKKSKYIGMFFYGIYPIHLLILAFLVYYFK